MMKVVWDNPQRNIIRLDYFSPVNSWEEYRAAVHQAHSMARSVCYPVYIIHNGQGVTMPSAGKKRALEELNQTINDLPDNVDLLLSVSTRSLENRISRIASQTSVKADSMNIFMVDAINLAYQLIAAYESGEDLHTLAS